MACTVDEVPEKKCLEHCCLACFSDVSHRTLLWTEVPYMPCGVLGDFLGSELISAFLREFLRILGLYRVQSNLDLFDRRQRVFPVEARILENVISLIVHIDLEGPGDDDTILDLPQLELEERHVRMTFSSRL